VYSLELSADSAGKWGAVSEEQTAETAAQSTGMAEWDAGTVVAHSSHRILHSGKACSAMERNEDE
jgi:predicted transcriptional regulator